MVELRSWSRVKTTKREPKEKQTTTTCPSFFVFLAVYVTYTASYMGIYIKSNIYEYEYEVPYKLKAFS